MTEPFERVVERHGATVLRVCRTLLGPGPDADDASSETFLAALHAWPNFSADTNVQAWLVRVAQRKAIDITRARSRHAVPDGEQPEQESRIGNLLPVGESHLIMLHAQLAWKADHAEGIGPHRISARGF